MPQFAKDCMGFNLRHFMPLNYIISFDMLYFQFLLIRMKNLSENYVESFLVSCLKQAEHNKILVVIPEGKKSFGRLRLILRPVSAAVSL